MKVSIGVRLLRFTRLSKERKSVLEKIHSDSKIMSFRTSVRKLKQLINPASFAYSIRSLLTSR
jgi:hypothetical protein